MLKGVITKGIGGFYYVDTEQGVFECRARGKFRIKNITPLVGDLVEIEENTNTMEGYLLDITDRKNHLIRPTIANIDQAVIVVAAKKPDINPSLLHRFLIYAEYVRLDIVICINKIDLDEDKNYLAVAEMLRSVPYHVIETCAKTGIGIEELKDTLKDKISVFAGPSGAGKSSLLNRIQPGLRLQTGDLSKKIDRGTHTTRHAELIRLESGGMVADTPGFTSLELADIKAEELQYYFPEFERYIGCRFSRCMHVSEPDCGVKAAVAEGSISRERYDFYVALYNELKSYRRY